MCALIKAVKLLYNFDYQANTLIADGAEAIHNGFMDAFEYENLDDFNRVMCWAHVDRATRKRALKRREKNHLSRPKKKTQIYKKK